MRKLLQQKRNFGVSCLVLFLLSGWCTVERARAQEDKVAEEYADVVGQLPQTADYVFLLRNMTKHIDSILSNKNLDRAFEKSGTFGSPIEEAKLEFESARIYFPTDVAISAPKQAIPQFGRLWKTLLLVAMASTCEFEGDGIPEGEVPKLLEDLGEQFRDFRVPPLSVVVKWEKNGFHRQAFTGLLGAITFAMEDIELKIQDAGKSAYFKFKIGDLLSDADIEGWSYGFGIDPTEYPEADKIGKHLLDLEIECKISRIDNGITVHLGPQPKELGYSHPTLFSQEALKKNEILVGVWNNEQFRKTAKELKDWIAAWDARPLGKLYNELDTSDGSEAFTAVVDEILKMSDQGHARAWAESDGLKMNTVLVDDTKRTLLKTHPIMKLVPADVNSYALSGMKGLGNAIIDAIYQYEGRLEMMALRDTEPYQMEMRENFIKAYYANFGKVRDVILNELNGKFEPVGAYLVDTNGQLDLSVRFGEFKRSQKGMRVLQFAAIGKPKDEGQIKRAIASGWKAMRESVSESMGIPGEIDIQFVDDQIGSTKIRRLDFGFIEEEFGIEVDVSGDLSPHYFFKDGFLVFSTSKKLSQKILSANNRMQISSEQVVDQVKYTGKSFSGLVDMYVDGFKFALDEIAPFDETSVAGALVLMKDVVEIVDSIHWQSIQKDGKRTTLYQMDLAK